MPLDATQIRCCFLKTIFLASFGSVFESAPLEDSKLRCEHKIPNKVAHIHYKKHGSPSIMYLEASEIS